LTLTISAAFIKEQDPVENRNGEAGRGRFRIP
jgi:hypothetical protein